MHSNEFDQGIGGIAGSGFGNFLCFGLIGCVQMGSQAIPRQIWLDSVTPTALLQLPIEEVKNLRSTKYEQTNVTLSPGSVFPAKGVQGVQVS
jgi:hypothetical protein